jgi:hypothetical protein
VSPMNAVNTLWLPVTVSGFAAILAYCSYLLIKCRTLNLYLIAGSTSHWLLVSLMAVLYTGSIFVYGIGSVRMGAMGPIIGFPVYMSTMIFTGNAAGLLTGEWKDSPRAAYRYGFVGMLALIASILVIALGNRAIS